MSLDPIRSVVILGGGTAGWMSAALLSKLMPNLHIRLVESDNIGTIGVGEATIPAIKRFNLLAGIDETAFMKATRATFKLGIEFRDWMRPGSSYIHGFGKIGQDLGWLRMHHYWLKFRTSGQVDPDFNAYSINTMAAYANSFMRSRPDMKSSPLSEIAYAYHFDAGLYARFLRRECEQRGVVRTEGQVAQTRLRAHDGFVEALVLKSGEVVEGDLFLDCSGMHAVLIERALNTGFEDWTHWLPCDRAIAIPCESVQPMTPYTRSTAHAAGWQWRIPLQHRIGNGHVFSSRYMGEDEAIGILMNNLDGKPLADPRVIRYTTGKRRKQWHKNVIAVGLSGGFLEPLESTSIHLIQSTLLRLIALFPDRAFAPVHATEFNSQTEFEYSRIRDFLIAHYHLNNRDEAMWRDCRAMAVPDSLKRKLDNFAAFGRIFKDNDELFAEESWIQVLLGQDLIPAAYDPAVELKSDDEVVRYLNDIATVIRKCIAVMPDHREYVAQTVASEEMSHVTA